ncbi:sensor histidine kinase [Sphaerisporangium perillae]|uniref:sensor histidine kinase n=1 Tax=Sphaerisporangium perillae TaxID=2935860 RepID=UPI00200F3193|nr:HAMP domain-containing sensor histidine kinase [Sphaerisporangium perillae]
MRLWHDRSVRTRLTWVASVVTALACLGVSVLVFLGLYRLAISHQTQDITLADLRIARSVHQGQLTPIIKPEDDVKYAQVVDDTGRVIAATAAMIGKPRLAGFAPPAEMAEAHKVICSPPGFPDTCLNVVVLRHYRPQGDWLVYGAAPVVPWYVDAKLLALVTGTSLFLMVVTAIGTYRIVRKTLAPVDDVCEELAEITASDLSRRVPLLPHHDEIGHLAETVNQTLDRLQQAVERQRRFASDAGHDLRSPITAMRTLVEEALLHPDETDWVKMAEAVVASLDRLQAIVTDLLVIARLDSGEKVSRSYINLPELVRGEVGRRPRGKRVVLDLQSGVVVSGDRLQLVRLLTNLLDNAERHAISTVTILLGRDDGQAMLQVIDDGEGVPPEQRELVFQRFTRLPSARKKDLQGTGLGLAIARDIAEHHGGTLTIEDSPVGARFVLRLPILTL